jgi:hypothetical protein
MCAGPASADIPGCPRADMPPASQKSLQKAAKREYADPLDLSTLYYCTTREFARATVDTVPTPQEDGSEGRSTLKCASPIDHPKDWSCEVDRYRAILLGVSADQPPVVVEVGDRATLDSTRARATTAFAMLGQPGRVEACRGSGESAQDTEALRAILARRSGPYRLVISREGFALMRGPSRVRFNAGGIECWEEDSIAE